MADPWHVKWLSEGVKRWNRRRRKVDFSPDLSGVKLFDLLPPDFRDDPKTSRFFEGIDLTKANLVKADLSGLNFYNAKFDYSDLTDADMSLSNFQNARFTHAVLSRANLSRSLLAGAFFEKTLLSHVSFETVNIPDAVFLESPLDSAQRLIAERQAARVFPDKDSYIAQVSEKASSLPTYRPLLPSPANKAESDRKAKRYDVFYGTNRDPVIARGALVGFGDRLQKDLSYGVCEVVVPEGHKVGSLGSPLWKRLKNRQDDRLKIKTLIALNESLFWSLLKETSDKMKVKERPTLFVHGFNNTFDNAVIRAAQIGFDLGLGQGIGIFSWPSQGKILGYGADVAAAEASKYALADFIEQFVVRSRQQSANIIAHSMGCRCVLAAMEVLSNRRKHVLRRINQVILAAADVDSNIMPRLGAHVVSTSKRTTSYVSDRDTALKLSGWLHSYPRVGITPPTFVLEGMDTIVVNNLDLGDFSHGYVGTSRTILSDMFSLLKYGSPPQERHAIEAVTAGGLAYWRIKE